MRALAAALLLLTAALPSAAIGQEAPGASVSPSEPEAPLVPGSGRIVSLARTERAPWGGLLIEQEDLVRWRLEIESLRLRLRLDVEALQARHTVEARMTQARLEAAQERLELHDQLWGDRATQLGDELLQARQDAKLSWYESPAFWYVLGVGSAVLVVVALGTVVGG